MTRLSVNINKIATLRNARGGNNPDVLKVAADCERFGAEGITVHPRPDERHIRVQDVFHAGVDCGRVGLESECAAFLDIEDSSEHRRDVEPRLAEDLLDLLQHGVRAHLRLRQRVHHEFDPREIFSD